MGPQKDVEIDGAKVNILIGQQRSGKSTLDDMKAERIYHAENADDRCKQVLGKRSEP